MGDVDIAGIVAECDDDDDDDDDDESSEEDELRNLIEQGVHVLCQLSMIQYELDLYSGNDDYVLQFHTLLGMYYLVLWEHHLGFHTS